MKIAFLADIHGNAVAMQAVLKDIEKKEVDKIYVLGDICYRGVEPKRSLELVRQLHTDVIKGNADEWVVRGVEIGEVPDQALEMMNKERDWTVSQLDAESIEYLKNLPTSLNLELEDLKIHAFHATPNSLFNVLSPDACDDILQEKLMEQDADIYLYAHIHKPFIRYINGKCIMNIGSVGLPFDGLRKSSYGLIEQNEDGWQTSIVRVSYDISQVTTMFEKSDYPNTEQMVKILNNGSL